MPDHVFRNDGGRFVDVSERSGVAPPTATAGASASSRPHLDDDDRIDIFVANDMTANLLFLNRGGFRFEETAAEAGVATNAEGGYLAGMGIACGDLDGDGRSDLAVTNFYGESTTFYQNLGGGQFADQTSAVQLAGADPPRARLRRRLPRRRQRRPARPGPGQRPRQRLPPVDPATRCRRSSSSAARPAGSSTSPRSAGDCWQVAPRRPRAGRRRPRQRRQARRPHRRLGPALAYFHNQGPAGHFLTLQLEGASPRPTAMRSAPG